MASLLRLGTEVAAVRTGVVAILEVRVGLGTRCVCWSDEVVTFRLLHSA